MSNVHRGYSLLILFLHFSSTAIGQKISSTKNEVLIGHVRGFLHGHEVYRSDNFIHVQQFPSSLNIDHDGLVDSLTFLLGVDSMQHEKGIMDNGLSPANGMYWAWQSGYIFVKWEGYVMKESEKVMQPFTYHLGGFQYPFRCDQPFLAKLEAAKPLKKIQLSFEPTEKLIQFVLASDFEIMSPQPAAVQMMKLFSQCLIVQ